MMRTSAAIGSFLVKVDYVLRFGNAIRCFEQVGRSAKELFLSVYRRTKSSQGFDY